MAAEEIIFKISADASGANKSTDELEANLHAVNAAAEELMQSNHELGATFEEVYGDVLPLSARLGELEDRMYELALAGKQNTAEFRELQEEAVRYRQTLISVDKSVDQLAEQGRGLGAALQLGSAVTAGYGAVQGSMIALGLENESLEKSFVKLQAVQTVLASLEQLKLALDKQSILVTKSKAIATAVMTAAQYAWTTATAGTTTAMGVLRLAMLAIPLVALVAGIVALVAVIIELSSATEDLEKIYSELNAAIEKNRLELDKQATSASKNAEHELALARAKGASIDEIHQKELNVLVVGEKARNKSLTHERNVLNGQYRMIAVMRAAGEDDMVKSLQTEIKASQTKYNNLKSQDGDYFRSRQLLVVSHETKKADQIKKADVSISSSFKSGNDSRKRKQEEADKLELDRIRLMRDMVIANIQDEDLQKMTMLKETHSRQREELIKKYGEDTMLIKQLTIKQIDEEAKLIEETNAKNKAAKKVLTDKQIEEDQKAFDKVQAGKRAQIEGKLIQMRDDFEARQLLEAEFAKFEMDQALLAKDLTEGEKLKIEQQYKQKIAELEKQASDRTLATEAEKVAAMKGIYESGFSAISSLSEGIFAVRIANAEAGSAKELELQKKAFEFNKKMQIAQATIAGIQGVQAAFTTASASPYATVLPAYPFIMAAAAGAQALGNILKIKATTFQGGGSVGGGGGGSVTPPSIGAPNNGAVAPNSDTTTLTGGLSGGQGIKVTLVDSEVKQALTDSAKVDVISMVG
mgnify:CR=1 FL=1